MLIELFGPNGPFFITFLLVFGLACVALSGPLLGAITVLGGAFKFLRNSKDPILCVLALSIVFYGGYQFFYKPTTVGEQIARQDDHLTVDDDTLKQLVNPPPSPVLAIKEGIIPIKTDGRFSYVHIGVNGSNPLTCLIDSGASILMLTRKQLNYLWDNHFITKADLAGESKGIGANGKSFKMIEMTLKRVDIGGVESSKWEAQAPNVGAAVTPDSDGSCLVGQTFLQRFKSWRIDNDKHELHLEFRS
jgi:hypothetical protein